ncbi:FAD-dependent monooxygenase [Kitasatospora purpeofusca]|uniref:FAD-dependent monooxygenase n=1 Tax=Kitasatospora purpeofusca TaxID=67352 RepID=UPI00225BF230|nr:FAD-dependent monooxygenase [Kitasatospora purpeofusca]MCX4690195.1 FAD-dependent monooxygenase [Kitasatospora purpeofusca]
MTNTANVATMTNVVIVGAGPTGLTLACGLARQGVAVRVLERAAAHADGSRGKTLNPRSLEILADLGIAEELASIGRTHLPFRKYFEGAFVNETEPFAGARPSATTPYPASRWLQQPQLEALLRERLAALGVEVELGAELVDVRQDADGAEAVLADGRRIAAEYVVACDGGRSTVRKLLGIPFVGEGDPEPMMVCGDVVVEGLEPGAWHQWFGPKGAFMLCPFEDSPRWQLQATPETAADGTTLPPSLESFQRLALEHTGRQDIRLDDATWLSTWRVNVRMAERYREGRVLLAGDCAHVHPTAGGLGMNTGIQDAWNLAWKLGHVVRGLAAPALLDTYQEERLPIAAWTLDVTSAGMAAVVAGIDTPGIGVEVGGVGDFTGLSLGYRWSSLAVGGAPAEGDAEALLRAGDRAPDGPCPGPDGTPGRLFERFAGDDFTLLGLGAGARPDLAGLPGHVRPVRVEDRDGEVRRAYGATGEALVLVRPDNHIALVTPAAEPGPVHAYLARLGATG